MKKAQLRNRIAVTLMLVFSGATAFLGWCSLEGVAMIFAFLILTPLIAAIVTKREIELSLLYVFLALTIYLIGLHYYRYHYFPDESWDLWGQVWDDAQVVGLCLFCALFSITPIYLARRFRREDEELLGK